MSSSPVNTVPALTRNISDLYPGSASDSSRSFGANTFTTVIGGAFQTGTFDPDEFATVDPSIVEKANPHYLGNGVNAVIVVITLFLFLGACTLNLGVMNHYWNRVKSIESPLPFMCFILSLSDLAAGICAGLHSILFILILASKDNPSSRLMWLAVPAHYLTFLAFKVSAFVSMIFAAIRSCNMVLPLYVINRKVAVVSIFIWLVLWSVISFLEMGLFVKQVGVKAFSGDGITTSFLMAFFYQPGKPKVIELLVLTSGTADDTRDIVVEDAGDGSSTDWECVADMMYTALPLILCVGVALVATVSQIAIHLSSSSSGEEKKGGVSVTVILIGVVFVLCASCTLHQPFSECLDRGAKDYKNLYMMGYLPFFLLAVLDPVVLLARVHQLRECVWNMVTRRSCRYCNSVKYNPVEH